MKSQDYENLDSLIDAKNFVEKYFSEKNVYGEEKVLNKSHVVNIVRLIGANNRELREINPTERDILKNEISILCETLEEEEKKNSNLYNLYKSLSKFNDDLQDQVNDLNKQVERLKEENNYLKENCI